MGRGQRRGTVLLFVGFLIDFFREPGVQERLLVGEDEFPTRDDVLPFLIKIFTTLQENLGELFGVLTVRSAANCFDVVAVRIEHKSSVVIFVVMRTETWGAIVFSPHFECCLIKLIHLFTSLRGKGDMNAK